MNANELVFIYTILLVSALVCTALGGTNLDKAGRPLHENLFAIAILASIIFPPIAYYFWSYSKKILQASEEAKERKDKEDRIKWEEERLKREAERQLQVAENCKREQSELNKNLEGLIADSKKAASSLSNLRRLAENDLNSAEVHLSNRASVPFWEAVERTANNLAQFNETTQRLIGYAKAYERDKKKLKATPPPYTIGMDTLPDATSAAQRMATIVYKGHMTANFGQTYLQMKTNQILVAGFSTLGQAIEELGNRLRCSHEQITSAIEQNTANFAREAALTRETINTEGDRSREHHSAEEEKTRAHSAKEAKERKERDEMADEKRENIQRRSKPFPPLPGYKEY